MRKVYLDDLPRASGGKQHVVKGTIEWDKCSGIEIPFVFDDTEGVLKVVRSYCKIVSNKKVRVVTVLYEDKEYDLEARYIRGCVLSSIIYNKYKKDVFIHSIGDVVALCDKEYVVINTYKKNNKNHYGLMCDECGMGFNCKESSLETRKYGCPRCTGKFIEDMKRRIESGKIKNNDIISDLIVNKDDGEMSMRCNEKIKFKCSRCGRIIETYPNSFKLNNFTCSMCDDKISFPNKMMYYILEELKIDFITEYSPKWIRPKRYDFYIPSLNIIIEMDGKFHFEEIKIGVRTLEETICVDNYKDRKASEYGIPVIRINCNYNNINERFDLIYKNLLNSDLEKYGVNISSINNWINIKNMICENMVRLVCDDWNTGEYNSTTHLSKKYHCTKNTISNRLKIGRELGWCEYDEKNEIKKGLLCGAEANKKPIKCNELNIIADSIKEMSSLLTKKLNDKYSSFSISKNAKGFTTNYKGLTFTFV